MTEEQYDKVTAFGRNRGDDGFGAAEALPDDITSFAEGISDLDFSGERVEIEGAYTFEELASAMTYAAQKDIGYFEDRILDPAFATRQALAAIEIYLAGTLYSVEHMVGIYFLAISEHYAVEDVELTRFNEKLFAFLDTVDLEASNSQELVPAA